MKLNIVIAVVVGTVFHTQSHAQGTADIRPEDADIQFSRVMRHKDGTTSRLLRTPNNEVLEKKTYMPGASTHCMRTVYRLDRRGNLLGCQIYDGLDQMLFKSRYGYDPSTGLLHEEQMFDARVKNLTPDGKNEMPIRRFIYTFDANGKPNKPIQIVLRPGRSADELYAQPSGLDSKLQPFSPDK
jgi:hypothetical protein